MRSHLAAASTLAVLSLASVARAGSFDDQGRFIADADAVASLDFSKAPKRYFPDMTDPACMKPGFSIAAAADAIDSGHLARIHVLPQCSERFVVDLPAKKGSYIARIWVRHGGLDAAFDAVYPTKTGLDLISATMAPTGRITSDGWIEYVSNEFPIDGTKHPTTYVKLTSYGGVTSAGVDVDALEVAPSGSFVSQQDCDGFGDPVCSDEEVCTHGRCALGRLAVPPLPAEAIRSDVVDVLEAKLNLFFGGKYSRANYLPRAIQTIETMRTKTTAWAFWNAFATAIHELHDWHTDTFGGMDQFNFPRRRLNVCFFEGDADLSHDVWPKDPIYADILVSHTGPASSASGLRTGDRLLAVDGMHPLAWAATLTGADWDFHAATDPGEYAEQAEELGGPYWTGGALIIRYAKTFTILRCDPDTGRCDGAPETLRVQDLANDSMGDDVACDNRPFYHFVDGDPDPNNHYVFNKLFRGEIANTTPQEAIYGMVWDNLLGLGDPNSDVNAGIAQAIIDWKASARGVILDHRAGNGGTLDAATNMTRLVRPPSTAAIIRMPIEIAGDPGPVDQAAGLALFTQFQNISAYPVGDPAWASTLPVALIVHRDGSASDYMPYGMKGAPNVKIFGAHQTAGAFSTFLDFQGTGISIQFASGDTIGSDGTPLLGHGVEPDVVVLQKQSDLVAGKDSPFEAALAWVRAAEGP
jgi:Peptidase family S41